MDGAANFPEISFVIFHAGPPFVDGTRWQLVRCPNLYVSTINPVVLLAMPVRRVDRRAHVLGGED